METDQGDLLKEIALFLDKNKIPYMLTGAWSVVYYGRPRASHDIDFIVEISKEDTDKVIKNLRTLSSEFLFQEEAVIEAVESKGMFNVIHLPTYLKLDFWLLKDNKFDRQRFSRREKVKLLNQFMYISSPEDTILKKLLWYKEAQIEKHLVDAAFVYQIQKDQLDMKYINKWVKKLKIGNMFEELKEIDLEKYI